MAAALVRGGCRCTMVVEVVEAVVSLLDAVEVRVRGRCPRLAGSASKGLMGQMP